MSENKIHKRKRKKVRYYIYSESRNSYWSDGIFEAVACPTYYFTRFSSIKSAEKEIKNKLRGSDDLMIETTAQVCARRKRGLVNYYINLLSNIRKSFSKEDFQKIIGSVK